MITISDQLDFQTMFQILGTFEAFSIWKGVRYFKAGYSADLGIGVPEVVDNETFSAMCDVLKNAPDKWKEIRRIVKVLLKGNFARIRARLGVLFWQIIRSLHRSLACLLRTTPFVTITALSLSYMLKIGCESERFYGGRLVFYFIVVKFFCYLFCRLLATMLVKHVKVEAPSSDYVNIIPDS